MKESLHIGCGGLVLPASHWNWKTALAPKQDGTLYCCLCGKQPVEESEISRSERG